jgi:PHP family Zn ribbon phosphoesterase
MTIYDIIQSKKKTKDINIMGVVHVMDPVYKLSVKRTAMKQGDTQNRVNLLQPLRNITIID